MSEFTGTERERQRESEREMEREDCFAHSTNWIVEPLALLREKPTLKRLQFWLLSLLLSLPRWTSKATLFATIRLKRVKLHPHSFFRQ